MYLLTYLLTHAMDLLNVSGGLLFYGKQRVCYWLQKYFRHYSLLLRLMTVNFNTESRDYGMGYHHVYQFLLMIGIFCLLLRGSAPLPYRAPIPLTTPTAQVWLITSPVPEKPTECGYL